MSRTGTGTKQSPYDTKNRCMYCELSFPKSEVKIWCPICNRRLRTKPRWNVSSRANQKRKENKK
jgi:hypothetical protein